VVFEGRQQGGRPKARREFYTDGIAVEKEPDAKYEATAGFDSKTADMTGVVWPVDSLAVAREGMLTRSEWMSLKAFTDHGASSTVLESKLRMHCRLIKIPFEIP